MLESRTGRTLVIAFVAGLVSNVWIAVFAGLALFWYTHIEFYWDSTST